MTALYNVGIFFYQLIISIASLFDPKAKQWIRGRRALLEKIRNTVHKEDSIVWFHCASLGEFEQGRPVLEHYRKQHPEYKILVTFFSPSGYEVRKNYPLADYIFYLPVDTARNAKRFVEIVRPKKAFFIKYDFWHHYIKQLHEQQIPIYVVSASFRSSQAYFKSYGTWFRKILNRVEHFFVQNQESADLLQSIGLKNYTLSGDTRFDRAIQLVEQAKELSVIDRFTKNESVLVAGSIWSPDEKILLEYIENSTHKIKYILAPHEIHESHIEQLSKAISKTTIRYSEITEENAVNADVLIIDNVGMLAAVYRYATVAYVGGAFGKGLHNILEAATYGLPVLFGNKHDKFPEASALIERGAAFAIHNYNELKEKLDHLFTENKQRIASGKKAKEYIIQQQGATQKISNYVLNM